MAHSLERRWAKLVVSYSRLKELYEKALERERVLVVQVREARAELRDLQRASTQYQRASKDTFQNLLATTRYAIVHLHDARDYVGAEKLENWLDLMQDTMQPVANVDHLIKLLEEWVEAFPFDDPSAAAPVWMHTKMMLDTLKGTHGETEN